ncbi:hypothetical protein JO84_gp111 [Aureococcus anophagefferens virus]|uniref:Uncharacterized protein n=1 Tax=Aureococcus anophagefferens virus TaxID=1474867 RepID=A0A076FM67_9VIRU|nr:hypothetical protein JO84_gp111 [Aureococcus anophagefferens virus]AII16973.1 hypothetical protein AaV_369 [Aureococcus anophagefferens virus]
MNVMNSSFLLFLVIILVILLIFINKENKEETLKIDDYSKDYKNLCKEKIISICM